MIAAGAKPACFMATTASRLRSSTRLRLCSPRGRILDIPTVTVLVPQPSHGTEQRIGIPDSRQHDASLPAASGLNKPISKTSDAIAATAAVQPQLFYRKQMKCVPWH